jgi:ABC-type nitrate/sulfonate/bicarbonate transport system substrate-binding protein
MKKALWVFMIIRLLLVGSLTVAAETYRLGVLPVIGWSEYRVADIKGFWEKQGVSVQLVDYATPIDTNRGGMQRRVDLKPVPMITIGMYRDEGGI